MSRSWSSGIAPGCSAAARSARGTTSRDLELPGLQRQPRRGGREDRDAGRHGGALRASVRDRVGALRSVRSGRGAPGVLPGRGRRGRDRRDPVGRGAPSGRLPVSLPRSAGAQPYSYLHPVLGGPSRSRAPTAPRCCRSATGCRTRRSATPELVVEPRSRRAVTFTASVRSTNTGRAWPPTSSSLRP